MATLFAWRLARAGYGISMLGSWGLALEALREKGVRLVDERGREQAWPVHAVQNPIECRGIKQSILLEKSWQTAKAAQLLRQCLSPDGVALTLQNGLGNYEMLAEALGKERVALGTTTTGATLLGPGLAKAAGEGEISIQEHTRSGPLCNALRSAGFKVNVVHDALALIWGKLVVNSAINPLTALLGVPNGELLQRPAARLLLRDLAQETAAVAQAEGVSLGFSDAAGMVEEVAHRTAGNYSSMLQDVRRAAPTEIEAICGAVSRAGRRHDIPTPLNDMCLRLVQAMVQASERVAEPAQ